MDLKYRVQTKFEVSVVGEKKAKILMTQVAPIGVSKLLSNQMLSRIRMPLPLYTT